MENSVKNDNFTCSEYSQFCVEDLNIDVLVRRNEFSIDLYDFFFSADAFETFLKVHFWQLVMIIFWDQRLIFVCLHRNCFIYCVKFDLFSYFPDMMMLSEPDSMKVWRKWGLSLNKRTRHKTFRGGQRLHVRPGQAAWETLMQNWLESTAVRVLCVINSVLLTECSIEINWIMVQNYTFKP